MLAVHSYILSLTPHSSSFFHLGLISIPSHLSIFIYLCILNDLTFPIVSYSITLCLTIVVTQIYHAYWKIKTYIPLQDNTDHIGLFGSVFHNSGWFLLISSIYIFNAVPIKILIKFFRGAEKKVMLLMANTPDSKTSKSEDRSISIQISNYSTQI